jgi:spermidine/putrescine-binding protein
VVSLSVGSWRASAAAKLTAFEWAGYDDKKYHKNYSLKYGAEPNFAFFVDEEEALQKTIAGFHPDVIHPCINSVGRFREAKVIKPIDTSRLTTWEKLFPALKTVKDVEVDGKFWIAPFDWGTSSVLYRSDLVHVSDESWHMLIDPQYKGKVSFLDAPDNVAAIAGLLVGAKDPMDMNDEEMAKAEGVLRRLHANVRFYWQDQTTMEQALASGEVVASWAWASSAINLTKEGVKVKYMAPKEGIMTWVCGLTLGADGPADEQEKYDFIDAMLAPESGKALIEGSGYGHSNTDSFKLADPAAVKKLGFDDPGKFLETGHFFEAVPAQKRKHIIDLWQNIRAGG